LFSARRRGRAAARPRAALRVWRDARDRQMNATGDDPPPLGSIVAVGSRARPRRLRALSRPRASEPDRQKHDRAPPPPLSDSARVPPTDRPRLRPCPGPKNENLQTRTQKPKMFALTQSAAVAPARVVAKAQTTAPKARFAVVAKADAKESRRAALVGFTAAAVAAAAKSAQAITIASQANTGGLGRATGKGQYSSNASMSGYTLEGIQTMSHSPKVKFGVMSEARAAAEAAAAVKYDAKSDVAGKK